MEGKYSGYGQASWTASPVGCDVARAGKMAVHRSRGSLSWARVPTCCHYGVRAHQFHAGDVWVAREFGRQQCTLRENHCPHRWHQSPVCAPPQHNHKGPVLSGVGLAERSLLRCPGSDLTESESRLNFPLTKSILKRLETRQLTVQKI